MTRRMVPILMLIFSLVRGGDDVEYKTCLWQVTSDHSDTLFILGSIHLLSAGDYPLNPKIDAAFDRSDACYFETDMDSLNQPAVLQKFMMAGFYTSGETLKENLPDSTYQRLDQALKQCGMNLHLMQSYKPWFVASMLSMTRLMQLGVQKEYGIDVHFYEKAKASGRAIYALEPIVTQVNAMSHLDDGAGADLIHQTLVSLDSIQTQFETIVQAWKFGETGKIDGLMSEQIHAMPKLEEVLLFRRNRDWANKIRTFDKQERNRMIIVGVGHLVGPNNLIEILVASGYKAKQL